MTLSTPAMQLVVSLSTLMARTQKRSDHHLNMHGISFTEFMVMHHLDSATNKTMRRIDLAESIGLTASGVTRLLNPMEKIHLVEKEVNPRDARVSLVKLSSTGQQIFAEASESFRHFTDSYLAAIDSKQIGQLLGLTQALL
ncbi:MAG: DNA-binding MarR family transcriptional regulator [Bacteroidia bacterium]|jgi:DNA-binding MarR family transcriptional regulator